VKGLPAMVALFLFYAPHSQMLYKEQASSRLASEALYRRKSAGRNNHLIVIGEKVEPAKKLARKINNGE
jgi:hypothetical protein